MDDAHVLTRVVADFKFINVIFGRQQADQLLCFVKGVLDERLHEGEFFCRDSGDIFYICMNETDRGTIRARLEGVMRASPHAESVFKKPLSSLSSSMRRLASVLSEE